MGSAEQKYTVPLSDGPDWTFDLIEQYEYHIDRIAKDFRLDIYPNQIEVITAEQMMDAYASIGMPINYTHWSFGKKIYSDRAAISPWSNGPGVRDSYQF